MKWIRDKGLSVQTHISKRLAVLLGDTSFPKDKWLELLVEGLLIGVLGHAFWVPLFFFFSSLQYGDFAASKAHGGSPFPWLLPVEPWHTRYNYQTGADQHQCPKRTPVDTVTCNVYSHL